eukprot:TRINITY_DN5081_c0_g1_i1.p1 TRINITY_DN5081_c0_g1~~TRINITY_DN5081_c0_g1_i1.p1  ORF type:complete len:203 (+),score=44.49 TRINITY_DN5081_c0_g1_i1:59-667(+)
MRLSRILLNKVILAVNETDVLESKNWDNHELSVYDPSPRIVIQKMLKMANLKKNEVLYDFGCGDGRWCTVAAKEFGAKAVGIELSDRLVQLAREAVTREQVSDKVTILQQNGFTVDLTPANVITLYYLRRGVELLKPKLLRELHPGTRVISVKFPVPGWRPVRRVKMFEYYVHLYTMPPQLLSVHEEAEMLHECKDLDDIGT